MEKKTDRTCPIILKEVPNLILNEITEIAIVYIYKLIYL